MGMLSGLLCDACYMFDLGLINGQSTSGLFAKLSRLFEAIIYPEVKSEVIEQ